MVEDAHAGIGVLCAGPDQARDDDESENDKDVYDDDPSKVGCAGDTEIVHGGEARIAATATGFSHPAGAA